MEAVEALLVTNMLLFILVVLAIYLLRNPPPRGIECEWEDDRIVCYFTYEEEEVE